MQWNRTHLQQSCHFPTLKKFSESWKEMLLTRDILSVLTGDTIRDILSLPTDSDSLTKLHTQSLWMTYSGEELETCRMIFTTSSWWHPKLWKWFVQHTTCKDNSRCNSTTAQPLVYSRYIHKKTGKLNFRFANQQKL